MALAQRTDPGFPRYTGDASPNLWTEHLADHNELHGASVSDSIAGVSFVIGSESSDTINVGIQLEDADGNAIASVGVVTAFLSDDSGGLGISGTAPATSVLIGTDGAIIVSLTAKLAFILQSEADGDIDLNIIETGVDTWHLVVVLANGTQVVSAAITFA